MTYRVYREHDWRYYETHESLKHYCYDRYNGECASCGESREFDDMHVHHVVPKSEGGSNDPGNLRLLCPVCHGLKHSKKPCFNCANLVPLNPYNGDPYWYTPPFFDPVCYDCKEREIFAIEYNVPEEAMAHPNY